MDRLRIAIDCRISNPQQGIGTAVLAFANALSQSADAGQEYTFIISEELREWLAPHIFGPCRIKTVQAQRFSRLKISLRKLAPLRAIWNKARSNQTRIPVSDGYVESEGFDVVHFPTQAAYLTRLPSIYQPWDLQHVHYPQFFSRDEWALRDTRYRKFCNQAEFVCVQTEWSRHDIIRQYGLSSEKVVVIRWGSVFDAYTPPSPQQQAAAVRKYTLPRQFFVYPAVTWPHKNHEDIIRAVHLLKTEHGRAVDVFFTGGLTDFRHELDELAQKLDVSSQLHYLGFVTAEELQSIFSAATAMIFASKFEGFGLPVLEAFHARLPVLCSNASVLPEVAQDGALYFTPGSPNELVNLMMQMLDDSALREGLMSRGDAVLSTFSIQDTVKSFQSLYAQLARKSRGIGEQHSQLMSSKPAGECG